jgi:glycosyltransferase involved in cell wall biosynthesis
MSRVPNFSIVIPTHNRLDFLKQALNSIWAQSVDDYEIIVVNDGSNDGTEEWLTTQHKRVRAFTQANRGPGVARNLGAHHACGKYLAFLDSDDLWFPWSLEVYQNVIYDNCKPSFVAGKPFVFTENNELSKDNELSKVVPAAARTKWFSNYFASGDQWRWWGVSSFVIRRDQFAAVGGFTNEWVNGEDADLALRLGEAAGFVQITAPSTFAYREHGNNAMKDMKRTLAGAWSTIQAEQQGRYPGGRAQAAERRRILTRHIRPVTLGCLREGFRRDAWALYASTFAWNASAGRLKYLAAFPFLAMAEEFRHPKIAGLIRA